MSSSLLCFWQEICHFYFCFYALIYLFSQLLLIFCLSLALSNLTMVCLSDIFLMFLCLRVIELLSICGFIIFTKFRKFLAITSSNVIFGPLPPPHFGDSNLYITWVLKLSHSSLISPFFSLFLSLILDCFCCYYLHPHCSFFLQYKIYSCWQVHFSCWTSPFLSLKVRFGFILYLSCVYILYWVFPPSSWDMEYSHNNLKILLYVNSIICILQVNLGDFWLLFLLILNCSFLQFCMPGTFCWDAKHYEFYFVGCWILLYPCKYSWALFWNAVKLLGNSIVEEQNSPPKMSLWHVNCFEQKQSRPKRFRKKSWPFPELPKNF